jgi:hypothetical protein
MILKVHLRRARCYEIGDEICQESLADAIHAEADAIAGYATVQLPKSRDEAHRDALRDRIIREMTSALVSVGDRYRAPDGVLYSLIDDPALDRAVGDGRLSAVSSRASEPIVEEVVRFENLPLGSVGSRRAIVRWSDGTEGAAIAWYADEILVCEGDHGNSRLMVRGSRSPRR